MLFTGFWWFGTIDIVVVVIIVVVGFGSRSFAIFRVEERSFRLSQFFQVLHRFLFLLRHVTVIIMSVIILTIVGIVLVVNDNVAITVRCVHRIVEQVLTQRNWRSFFVGLLFRCGTSFCRFCCCCFCDLLFATGVEVGGGRNVVVVVVVVMMMIDQ